MKKSLLYPGIAILAFGVGTFFAFYFFSRKLEIQPVSQNEILDISSKKNLQTETQTTEINDLPNFDDLKVKGIGLGSFESDLVKEFGKPQKVRNDGDSWNCLDSDTRTLFYRGLKVVVTQELESKKYRINDIDISSSKFHLDSGIKIGDEINDVFLKVGKPYHQTKSLDLDQYHFAVSNKNDVSNDGGIVTFSFRKNKLVKIHWDYNFC